MPANPVIRPITRSRVNPSPRNTRASTAAKNGALFRSTEATAAPASRVPSAIPASVTVTFPKPIRSAQPQPTQVDGSRAPTMRSTGSITSPPTRARQTEITAGLVRPSAAPVTG